MQLRQAGFAALAFVLMIIVVATILAGGIAQVGANDQKEMAHEWRSRQAAAAAESGLARGVLYLRQNKALANSAAGSGWLRAGAEKWSPCRADETAPPCGDGKINVFDARWTAYRALPHLGDVGTNGTVSVHLVTRAAAAGSARPGEGVYELIADARSQDGSAVARVRKALRFHPYLAHRPEAPLLVAGRLAIDGSLNIVAHPNGGGPGVPLSAWTREDLQLGGAQTCHLAEYLSSDAGQTVQIEPGGLSLRLCPACRCPAGRDLQLSGAGREGIDILDVDGASRGGPVTMDLNPDSRRFPADVFEHVFGMPQTDAYLLRDQAQPLADCAALNAASAGLYWLRGDCGVPADASVGSLASPVLLIVEDGAFTLGAHAALIGVVFLLQQDEGHRVQLDTGAIVHGALLSNRSVDLGATMASVRYEAAVLAVLNRGGAQAAAGVAEVPGTWTNYRQP